MTGDPSSKRIALEGLVAELTLELSDWETSEPDEYVSPGPLRGTTLYRAVQEAERHYGGKLPEDIRDIWQDVLHYAEDEPAISPRTRYQEYYKCCTKLKRWANDEKSLMDRDTSARDAPVPPSVAFYGGRERYIVSDTTVEALVPLLLLNPRGLLLARDELAGWIASFDRYAAGKGGADAAHWLSMHNGESIIVDRKTGTPRTIHVPQACVCVCGGIQPMTLHRALGVEHRESGLAARLLLACPPRQAKRWTEADIDPALEAEIGQLIDRLNELESTVDAEGIPRAVKVGLTPDAKAAWKGYYNLHAEEQTDLSGELSAAWSKLEEYAARLALVIHFARWAAADPHLDSGDTVDVVSMTAGIRLATWFKGQARRVYSLMGESDDDRDRRRLVEWIGRKGDAVTARDVQMGCRWLREAGAAEAALEALVKSQCGTWEWTAPGRPGQPTRYFCLSKPTSANSISASSVERGDSVDVDDVDAPQSETDVELEDQ